MTERIVLGDEAIALGAIDAGVSCAYGYPGTPSTEIMEFLINYSEKTNDIFATWSANEKTAYEEALGTSFAGKRVMVTMKHVGLNVAADPFMNSALLKMNGGLVLAIADDPGMHSSQNEQDSRTFAEYAGIPCFEPVNQQEAYDMTREAFEVSEKYNIPVMIRLVTRLSHSRAVIKMAEKKEQVAYGKSTHKPNWMLLPALARKNLLNLIEKQKEIVTSSSIIPFNTFLSNNSETLVITTGLGRNYYKENEEDLPVKFDHLHIGFYPLPEELIEKAVLGKSRLLIIEEGAPVVEKSLRSILASSSDLEIKGKMDGSVTLTGELNPDNVRGIMGLADRERFANLSTEIPGRPPQLCQGCPHADSYTYIKEAIKSFDDAIVTADIGCYALGATPPFSVPETIVCMGASIGMARGTSDAGFKHTIAVIGDSTFLHSGMTGLIDAVSSNTPMTVIILDNSIVAMTGGQETIIPSSKLESLVLGLGVDPDHLKIVNAHRKSKDENIQILKQEMDYMGLSVLISVRECVKTAGKPKKEK